MERMKKEDEIGPTELVPAGNVSDDDTQDKVLYSICGWRSLMENREGGFILQRSFIIKMCLHIHVIQTAWYKINKYYIIYRLDNG